MRKIKAGAIQPAYIGAPEHCDPASSTYHCNSGKIVHDYVQRQLDVTARLLEQAGEAGCDIVTTSEGIDGLYPYAIDVTGNNIYAEIISLSVPMVEDRLSQIARKYNMYVIGCYNKRDAGKNYNTAVLYDRKGGIAGQYRKTHLPADETWQTTPGDRLDVFELDFGVIGISICYDIMFPEQSRVLALKGAEAIFHPTLGYGWYEDIGEATLRTRANDNGVYIITAKNYMFNGPGRSGVIDRWGHILADAGYRPDAVVCSEIDLDEKKIQPDWYFPTVTSGIADVALRQRRERRPELYGQLAVPAADQFRGLDRATQLEVLEKIRLGECHW